MSKKKRQRQKKRDIKTLVELRDTDDVLKDAIEKLNDDETKEAEQLCRSVLKNEPENTKANYYLGLVLYEEGKYDEALKQFELALNNDKDRYYGGYIHHWIGKIYDQYKFDGRDESLAKQSFEIAKEYELFPPEVLFELARLCRWNDEEALANRIELLKEGIDRFPEEQGFYLDLARILINRKDDSNGALYILHNALSNGAESPAIWYQLAQIHCRQREFDDARLYYSKILSSNKVPGSFPVITYLIADTHLDEGNFIESTHGFLESIKLDKDNKYGYAAYFGLITAYCKSSEYEKAIDIFLKIPLSKELFDSDYEFGNQLFFLGESSPEEFSYTVNIEAALDALLEIKQVHEDRTILGKISAIEALLSKGKGDYKESESKLIRSLKYVDLQFLVEQLAEIYEFRIYSDDGEYIKGKELTDYIKDLNHNLHSILPLRKALIKGNKFQIIVEILFQAKKYKDIVGLCELCEETEIDEAGVWFEFAYSLNELGETEKARLGYERQIQLSGETCAILNNLANIYKHDGQVQKAIDMYKRAIELEPGDTIAKGNLDRTLQQEQERLLEREKELNEQKKIQRLYKTAPERFSSLDRYKKRLLLTLHKIDGFSGFNELASLCSMEEHWVKKHYEILVEKGMIIEDASTNKYSINKEIIPLLERENSHSVAINVIKAAENIRFKPIFNSRFEYSIYNIVLGLFPNHLIFPNMALSSIFSYERMREVLDSDTFKYFLMASVDICIVSTANYLPLIAYEVDSSYHDDPVQKERDAKKDSIFELGGVYLLRIRTYGEPSLSQIRQQIIDATKDLGSVIDPLERQSGKLVKLLDEIDFDKFGNEENNRD